jgi:hypothetical protein
MYTYTLRTAEAGHILYLRILYPIHILAPKKDIISYPYPGPKKGYRYISYILCQIFCQHCHSFWTTKSQTWQHCSTQVLDFLLDQIKTLIYQQRSKEIANHSRNGRTGSAKGKMLPLKPKISGTERWKKDIGQDMYMIFWNP